MAQITDETTYAKIKMGDTFEDGGEVVGIVREPARSDSERDVITLTIRHYNQHVSTTNGVPFYRDTEHSTGAMWADETMAVSRSRAEFMHSLVDHS